MGIDKFGNGINMDELNKLIKKYRLKDLNFRNANREYTIEFNRQPILQLEGDSGTGKSLLAHDLKEQRGRIDNFPEILVIDAINYETLELIRLHRVDKYNLIVIDNADILIDKEIDRIICEMLTNSRIYWIIMGRNWFNCCSYEGCRCVLESKHFRNKHIFRTKYINTMLD